MKKSSLYTLILGGLAATSSVAIVGIASATDRSNTPESANNSTKNNTIALADSASDALKTVSIPTKDETVFLMADNTGTINRAFIGNNLYTGSKSTPVAVTIKYYLNGEEISANAVKGQSGHVKIEFSYHTAATYQGKAVPFMAATGVMLDANKFSNLQITNGKIASSGSNYVVLGYGLPGLNTNFGADLVPERFIIEADTTDFSLDTTYTVFTTSLIADLDTSKLNSADSLINSMNELGDGIDQILTGASSLSDNLKAIVEKTAELSTGISKISSGLNTIASKNDAIMAGAGATFDGLIKQANDTLNENVLLGSAITMFGEKYGLSYPLTLTHENYNDEFDKLINFVNGLSDQITSNVSAFAGSEELAALVEKIKQLLSEHPELIEKLTELGIDVDVDASLDKIISLLSNQDALRTLIPSELTEKLVAGQASLNAFSEFYAGLSSYTNGVSAAANSLSILSGKMPTLVNGETELYHGSVTLKEGISTFKTTGIDKLVNFANSDATNFVYNARKSVDAARSYHNFANPTAETVKFVVKTAGIK